MNSKKILFIHTQNLDEINGGSAGTKKNIKILQHITNNVIVYCVRKKINRILAALLIRLNFFEFDKIKDMIVDNSIEYVFFDTSNCGFLVKKVKRFKKSIKIVSYFHNCESRYICDQLKINGIHFYILYILTSLNEKLTCKYSDKCVFITENDRAEIIKRYKIALKKWDIVPVLLNDTYKPCEMTADTYLLFFGNAFFANIEAAEYLIHEIMPAITHKVVIVGNGMDKALEKYTHIKNLQIIGFVEDVSRLFSGAAAFVSPIFSGSGMKVKIAEALMHGKKIICSEESIIGYKRIDSMVVCNTKEAYISAINDTDMQKTFYQESRDLFLQNYSYDSVPPRFSSFDALFD